MHCVNEVRYGDICHLLNQLDYFNLFDMTLFLCLKQAGVWSSPHVSCNRPSSHFGSQQVSQTPDPTPDCIFDVGWIVDGLHKPRLDIPAQRALSLISVPIIVSSIICSVIALHLTFGVDHPGHESFLYLSPSEVVVHRALFPPHLLLLIYTVSSKLISSSRREEGNCEVTSSMFARFAVRQSVFIASL